MKTVRGNLELEGKQNIPYQHRVKFIPDENGKYLMKKRKRKFYFEEYDSGIDPIEEKNNSLPTQPFHFTNVQEQNKNQK